MCLNGFRRRRIGLAEGDLRRLGEFRARPFRPYHGDRGGLAFVAGGVRSVMCAQLARRHCITGLIDAAYGIFLFFMFSILHGRVYQKAR